MTINIGILEDEIIHIENLKRLLFTLENVSEHTFNLLYYTSFSTEILSTLFSCDILFLDIEIGEQNGISIAHLLRNNGYQGCIIFLTAYKEYVFEGYKVNATDYLLKPISLEQLNEAMNRFYHTLKSNCYSFQSGSKTTQIPYAEIIYFSSYKHYVEIQTSCSTYQQLINLKSLLTSLPPQFVQCHRTTIINLMHIRSLTNAELTMTNGRKLPVSRTYLPMVQSKFMEYI